MATLIGCRFLRKSWLARLPTPSSHTRHQSPLRFSEKTRTVPIVFVLVSDPVGEGFVASLPRPGGNITGFVHTEGEFAGKLLELLTEIAPTVKRVAIMFNPDTAPGRGSSYLPSFETAARSFGLEAIAAPVRNDAEIQAIVAMLGREEGGGLVAMPDGFTLVHRAPMILQAARNKIPAVYWNAIMARDGGLLSYGPDTSDIFRRAAPYFDRILRGEKPGDLPVQAPTKFELVINLKTAKALGIEVPLFFQQRADEVIE
jgi:putative tryptophan/tyrosine transport system substrate-binding protein